MLNRSNFFSLEVYDVDLVSRNVHYDNLPVVEHNEPVYDLLVSVLEENIALSIDMHDALILTRSDYFRKNKGVIEGR